MKKIWFLILLVAVSSACLKKPSTTSDTPDDSPAQPGSSERFIYVAAGACYSGPNATFTNLTSSNQIYRISLTTGQRDLTVADYWTAPANPGDSPVGMLDTKDGSLLALVENTSFVGLRRIEKISQKSTSNSHRTVVYSDTVALNSNLREILPHNGGNFIVTKAKGIELFTKTFSRIGAPYWNPSVAPCAGYNVGVSRTIILPNGRILFLHAATSKNQIGSLPSSGGTTCSAMQAAPVATAFPVAAFYDSERTQLIVAFSGTSTASSLNSIYAYTVNESTGALSSPIKIYDAGDFPALYPYFLYSISSMAYDPTTSSVFIASSINATSPVQNYKIERFKYDGNLISSDPSKVLSVDPSIFYSFGADTKCISQMIISD